jgi:hypothetical protein
MFPDMGNIWVFSLLIDEMLQKVKSIKKPYT